MRKTTRLSAKMTVKQFDSGYWYATEIRKFARSIGIPSSGKLRKDELEAAIRLFIRTGKRALATTRKLSKTGDKDSDRGLDMRKRVIRYTNNPETKDWIVKQARRLDPTFKEKSGARLRLNRWREKQVGNGVKLTYGDLVRYYVTLNHSKEAFTDKFPSGRYINFLSAYLANETNARRGDAIKAWHQLKALDIPKSYEEWKRHSRK